MKLATTTADFKQYAATPAERVRFFEGTGFRYLDLNLYESIFPDSPLLDDRWQAWIDDAGEAAAALAIRFKRLLVSKNGGMDLGAPIEMASTSSRKRFAEASRAVLVRRIPSITNSSCRSECPPSGRTAARILNR